MIHKNLVWKSSRFMRSFNKPVKRENNQTNESVQVDPSSWLNNVLESVCTNLYLVIIRLVIKNQFLFRPAWLNLWNVIAQQTSRIFWNDFWLFENALLNENEQLEASDFWKMILKCRLFFMNQKHIGICQRVHWINLTNLLNVITLKWQKTYCVVLSVTYKLGTFVVYLLFFI